MKELRVFLIIILIIFVLGIVFWIVDYNRVKDGKLPIFCIKTDGYLDGGTKEYYGLGYKVIDFNRLDGYDEIKIGSWFMSYEEFADEYEKFENNSSVNEEILDDKSFIIEKGEMQSRGLFGKDGDLSYENDLLDNNMTYHPDTRLYYRIINNMIDYNVYKERIEIPELNEKDFENNFLLVVSNENVRLQDETDLEISDVFVIDDVMQIAIKQKGNPNYNSQTNVFWAFVDNTVLKDKVNIIIEYPEKDVEYQGDTQEALEHYRRESEKEDRVLSILKNHYGEEEIERIFTNIRKETSNTNDGEYQFSESIYELFEKMLDLIESNEITKTEKEELIDILNKMELNSLKDTKLKARIDKYRK